MELACDMKYRAVWISDVHLGSRHAQVGKLLEFLRDVECERLYIVGDFLDGWLLRRKWYWNDDYNVLIQKLLRKNRKETKVIFLIGNHDEFLEKFCPIGFGSVRLVERAVHVGLDGKRYLVLHGHQFDGLTAHNRLLDRFGSVLYDQILTLNTAVNKVRRRMGFGYWSFASYLKMQAKAAVKYVSDYEHSLIQFTQKKKMAGVICGHIHRPEIRTVDGTLYMNCGDWVENCTALVERLDGKFSLIKCHEDHVHSAGRGPGPHDPGDRGLRDVAAAGPRSDRGPGGREPQPELAFLL